MKRRKQTPPPARDPRPRCRYCGAPSRARVCRGHADLVRLDPHFAEARLA